jgi:hypothetical protein
MCQLSNDTNIIPVAPPVHPLVHCGQCPFLHKNTFFMNLNLNGVRYNIGHHVELLGSRVPAFQ